MKVQINALSMTSIYDSLFDLEKFRKKLEKLATELPKSLAEIGAEFAKVQFSTSVYDILLSGSWSTPNITVTAEPIENGFKVVASGKEVCFVEFGAGVWYNGNNSSYLGRRPAGIVGIGKFGKGNGKRDFWVFKDGNDRVFTNGTPANNCMYYTKKEIANRIKETARRILNE